MSTVVAITGKGGVGKTTVAGLIIRYLKQNGKGPVLAVDADPDSNLPEALGLEPEKSIATIGGAREDFFVSRDNVPAGMPKEAYLELTLNQVIIESKDIDLLIMGRPEGSGCYCYINNVLRKHLETLGKNYPYVIIDNEAGLEHLSRRTAQDIDYLLVVSDYSLNGLRAAIRIKDLAEEMKLNVKSVCLIINNVPESVSREFMSEAEKTGIPILGFISEDSLVPNYDIQRKPIIGLPDSSPVVTSTNKIAEKIF